MRVNKDYTEAIAQAKANLADLRERGEDALGGDALEFMDSLLTPEEIAASNLRVAMMSELVHARTEKGISQKKLEELSGVKQPIIARMEKGYTSPQLDTILKVLIPLGKTLYIGDLPRANLS
jgi:predicted XRE-type DNA-binding protein